MSNISNFSFEITESLAAHEAFRQMGFSPDQIFVMYNLNEEQEQPAIFVVVRAVDLDFKLEISKTDMTVDQFEADWKVAADLFNETAPLEDVKKLWQGSMVRAKMESIREAVRKKGLVPPSELN